MGAKNIHVIYNKVDTSKFSNISTKKFSSNIPTILSVGRLIDQKDHSVLIDAVKEIDSKLLIIGDGPNFDPLNSKIEKLGLADKVEIIKKIPNDELPAYYASCEVYAQPMKDLGGIPIPVLEAMACGLPVVMSNHSNEYREIIDDVVVFAENNGSSFSKAIKEILSNSEYREGLKRKSLNLINQVSGTKMAEKETTLYKKLIENKLKST